MATRRVGGLCLAPGFASDGDGGGMETIWAAPVRVRWVRWSRVSGGDGVKRIVRNERVRGALTYLRGIAWRKVVKGKGESERCQMSWLPLY